MIARLENNTVLEIKNVDWDATRLEGAEKGYGWYPVFKDERVIKAWEYVKETNYIYNSTDDVVRETKVVNTTALATFKKQKKSELKFTYEEITYEGFTCTNGIKLDCRESDKINWLGLKLQASQGTEQDTYLIRDFDNIDHNILKNDLLVMLTELEAYYNKILNDKWTHENILNSYTTYQEVHDFYWRKQDEEGNYIYWSIE